MPGLFQNPARVLARCGDADKTTSIRNCRPNVFQDVMEIIRPLPSTTAATQIEPLPVGTMSLLCGAGLRSNWIFVKNTTKTGDVVRIRERFANGGTQILWQCAKRSTTLYVCDSVRWTFRVRSSRGFLIVAGLVKVVGPFSGVTDHVKKGVAVWCVPIASILSTSVAAHLGSNVLPPGYTVFTLPPRAAYSHSASAGNLPPTPS